MSKFKIKSSVPYEIMLSETGATPIESNCYGAAHKISKKN
jgi:hypothetical protein